MKLHQLEGQRVGVCVSGGLDSKTVTTRLKQAGVDVLCFTADLAQPDEANIEDIVERMRPTGAETIIVDLKPEMAEACYTMIQAQAMYDGGYWNTTGIARAVTVKGLIAEMRKRGCTVLAHGATGRGNDQLRFERYTNVLAPEMPVYAPWRDPVMLAQFPGRREMAAYLQDQGIEATVGPKKRYSTDANLAGVSHEAEDLEDIQTSCLIVEPVMGVWPMQAPDDIESVTVRFELGRCVAINGQHVTPLAAMTTANVIGGRNGLGLKNALENRVIGTKSRGVYEAPGLELLGHCMRCIYQTTMDRTSTAMFNTFAKRLADHIYDGRYFDPSARSIRAAIGEFARHATGTVEVGLYKGNIFFKALRDCPSSLYNPADASMEASDGLNPVSSQGYVEVQAVAAKAMAYAGQIFPDDVPQL
ncbi:MAG: argininosuccinate synthase [Nannocystaceae bacterium]